MERRKTVTSAPRNGGNGGNGNGGPGRPKKVDSKKLLPREKRFVEEYMVDLNATRAAREAGYKVGRDSAKAWELMQRPRVLKAIQRKAEAIQRRTDVKTDDIIKELAALGFSDIRRLFDENGRLKRPEEWDWYTAKAIASIEVVARRNNNADEIEYVHKIRFWDKKGSLELLGKHFQMFTDRIDHSGTITVVGTGYPGSSFQATSQDSGDGGK